MSDLKFIIRLFEIIENADNGLEELLLWNASSKKETISFAINCNDIFWWACADAESITPDNLHILESAIRDTEQYLDEGYRNLAGELFCARVRKMRPQGAAYSYFPESTWDLFNACGEEREICHGNPCAIGAYIKPQMLE